MGRRSWTAAACVAALGCCALALAGRGDLGARLSGAVGLPPVEGQAVPDLSIGALGRIEPATEVVRIGLPDGDRIGRVLVAEGEDVHAGDPLAEMALRGVRSAEREEAERRLRGAEAQVEAEKALGAALVREAKARLERAEALAPLEIEARAIDARARAAALDDARRSLARVVSFTSAVSVDDRDAARIRVCRAEEALEAGTLALARSKREREIEVEEARARVASAETGLLKAVRAIDVRSLEGALASAQARLDDTVVRAPTDGRILKLLAHAGERSSERPLARMGDMSRLYVRVEVDQTQIRFVEVGQKVVVSSPALAAPVNGTVERIGGIVFKNDVFGDDPTAATNARVVEVMARLESAPALARLVNLEVDVRIVTRGEGERTVGAGSPPERSAGGK